MNNLNEYAYWMALAHAAIKTAVKNDILSWCHKQKKTVVDFFGLNESEWNAELGLDIKDIDALSRAKEQLPNNAFMAENLINQGYSLISSMSPEFPQTLKKNLKMNGCPVLLYAKGNIALLNQPTAAVVGARAASEISIDFTRKISKKVAEEGKVVVSGFAKGVDREALDAAVKAEGSSIIVLPQGILTFSTGFKQYYKQIVEGKVLVVSAYPPKMPWSTWLAMDRNTLIYGMADEIYVAESNNGGGTWSGVIEGLKRGRKIFIREPNENEKNANKALIEKGCVPIKIQDNIIELTKTIQPLQHVSEKQAKYSAKKKKKDSETLDLFGGGDGK